MGQEDVSILNRMTAGQRNVGELVGRIMERKSAKYWTGHRKNVKQEN
jgi:hypothetical protein